MKIPGYSMWDVLGHRRDVFHMSRNAARAGGMQPLLESDGEWTLFAPTNGAWSAKPEAATMRRHVVARRVAVGELRDGQELLTLAGERVLVRVGRDGVVVGGARLVEADCRVDQDKPLVNGVVHAVGALLGHSRLPVQGARQSACLWDWLETLVGGSCW
jgi:uncharacterized surface protein with fasciclin (FAS1) repeats